MADEPAAIDQRTRLHWQELLRLIAEEVGTDSAAIDRFFKAFASIALRPTWNRFPIPGIGEVKLVNVPERKTVAPFGPQKGQMITLRAQRKLTFQFDEDAKRALMGRLPEAPNENPEDPDESSRSVGTVTPNPAPRSFEEIAEAHGFGGEIDVLRQNALPCAGFTLCRSASPSVGASRLGGGPDVPRSFQWPYNEDRPLDFLLQVNLADVYARTPHSGLPAAGLLSFFYDLKARAWGYDPEDLSFYRVCYFEEGSSLERQPPSDSRRALPIRSLGFWPAQSLPSNGSRAGARLLAELEKGTGKKPDQDALGRLQSELFRAAAPTPSGPAHRLGGHACNIQGDMQLQAELVTNGLYCGDSSGYNDPRRKGLESSCEEWTLVLQLDSDDIGRLMWGDAGMLYFWGRTADISNRDFSKAWATLQCH